MSVAVLVFSACFALTLAHPVKRATELFDHGVVLSKIQSPELNEISGIAASRRHPGVIYVINDSGATNRLYAVDASSGDLRATFRVRGAMNCDWEDLAIGPGPYPGKTYIYIGDVGGNALLSCQTVYRIVEPEVLQDSDINVNAHFRFPWPDDNCETLMVSPAGVLYLVSKTFPENDVRVYEVPEHSWDQKGGIQLSNGSLVNIALEPNAEGPVSGDISPNGQEILLKTYNNIYLYTTSSQQERVQTTLARDPQRLFYNVEEQGESISYDSLGQGFFTVSEGSNKEIWYYARLHGLRHLNYANTIS